MNDCIKLDIARGNNGLMALKLDINKANDRVEWSLLKHTMESLGFSIKWINLIMNCITTPTFSVIINGATKGLIQPQRGLRQGCPMSPYLFLLCTKVFPNLMWQAERQNLIHGLRFDRNITISHLLFMDDSLIFTRASVDDCKQLKKVFVHGQVFNYEKSFMFFSGKIPEGQTTTIKDIFQLNIVSRHEKYLRLPSIVGRKRTSFFNNVKLKVLSKISN